MLILKILDSRPDGEAPTSEIAQELARLDSSARENFLPLPPIEGGLFGAGLITSPRKGVWRISDEGRKYLKSGDPRNRPATGEATLPPKAAAVIEISDDDQRAPGSVPAGPECADQPCAAIDQSEQGSRRQDEPGRASGRGA